jgi:hypothetical protein
MKATKLRKTASPPPEGEHGGAEREPTPQDPLAAAIRAGVGFRSRAKLAADRPDDLARIHRDCAAVMWLPDAMREAAMREVAAAARAIPDDAERANALLSVGPFLRENEREAILLEGLAIATTPASEAYWRAVLEEYKTESKATVEEEPSSAIVPPAPHIGGQTGEFLPNAISSDDAIVTFSLKDVPESERRDLIADMARMRDERAEAARRPKWDERDRYAELKKLSSPMFLKRAWADEIAPDGTIEKRKVGKIDSKLMGLVEAYISEREGRGLDAGDAEGLRFVTSPAGRPKRATLG